MENDPSKGAPAAPPPASGNGAPTSVDVKELVEALKTHPDFADFVRQEASKTSQSVKDRRIAGMEKRLESFESLLTEYQELRNDGVSHKVALRLMREGAEAAQPETGAPQPPAPATPKSGPSISSEHLEVMGLDPNAPEVARLLRENATLDRYVELAVQRKATRTQVATPAAVLPTGGGTENKPDLESEYQAAVAKIPRGDVDQVMRLKFQFRERAKKLEVPFQH